MVLSTTLSYVDCENELYSANIIMT